MKVEARNSALVTDGLMCPSRRKWKYRGNASGWSLKSIVASWPWRSNCSLEDWRRRSEPPCRDWEREQEPAGSAQQGPEGAGRRAGGEMPAPTPGSARGKGLGGWGGTDVRPRGQTTAFRDKILKHLYSLGKGYHRIYLESILILNPSIRICRDPSKQYKIVHTTDRHWSIFKAKINAMIYSD